VGQGVVYTDADYILEVVDPASADSTDAVGAVNVEVVDKDMISAEFPMDKPFTSVLIRYAYRNDVCPSREVGRRIWCHLVISSS
jgi:hypothetical protein